MEKFDFNKGWIYKKVDRQNTGRAEESEVNLPHDAMLQEPRLDSNPGGKNTGYFSGGDYRYKKTFFVPKAWEHKKIILEFEGIYHNGEIFLNGKKVAHRPSGYADFYVETDGFLDFGEDNRIEVLAHNTDQPNSRWYSGAGLYRPVWIYVGEKDYIPPSGVQVHTTEMLPPKVEFLIRTSAPGRLRVEVWDEAVCIGSMEQETTGEARLHMELKDARPWSVDSPVQYTYRVYFGDDCSEGNFGIRLLQWDTKKGFSMNGKRLLLKGACIHHDNGLLGACSYPDAEERKVQILKENGYNAIRCAHNPCSKALLDACDRLGMLVMDEYTDMWYIHKTAYDYADYMEKWWKEDLKDMVAKDYNHPSVILYSTGNEVAETAQKKGISLTKEMTEYLHKLDATRPVTCGINIFFNLLSSMGFGVYSDKKAKRTGVKKKKPVGSEFYNTLAGIFGDTAMKLGATLHGCDVRTRDAFANMDIAGYNYGILRYRHDLNKYSNRLILGTETFCKDAHRFYEIAKEEPRIIGDFVWAGMDYIGETGIGAWEYEDYAPKKASPAGWLTAGSGRIDITGKPLGEAAYTRIAFEHETGPLIAVRPVYQNGAHSPSAWKMTNALESWSYRGCEGMNAVVEVYTRAAGVALYLNGQFVNRKKRKKDCRIFFSVPYENGELMAIAYDAEDRELSRHSLFTAGEETILQVIPEKETVRRGGLSFIRIRYTDREGILKPMERHKISVMAEGGYLMGLGSACPYNPEGYLNSITDTYYGEALAIIRADSMEGLHIDVTDGKRTAHAHVLVKTTD